MKETEDEQLARLIKYHEIVERLKKRIEEVNLPDFHLDLGYKNFSNEYILFLELQKILEG